MKHTKIVTRHSIFKGLSTKRTNRTLPLKSARTLSNNNWHIRTGMKILNTDNEGQRIIGSPMMSSYMGTLANANAFPSRSKDRTGLICFDIWWLDHKEPTSPVAGLGLSIHHNGLLSAIVTPRYNCSEKVISVFEKHNLNWRLTPEESPQLFPHMEARARLIFATDYSEPKPWCDFLNVLNGIAPLGENVRELQKNILSAIKQIDFKSIKEPLQRIEEYHTKVMPITTGQAFQEAKEKYRQEFEGAKRDLETLTKSPLGKTPWLSVFDYPQLPENCYNLSSLPIVPEFPSIRYNPLLHDVFPTGRTLLGQAIRRDDFVAVQSIVASDPLSIFRPDAYNCTPLSLVLFCGNQEMFRWLIERAMEVRLNCPGLYNERARMSLNYQHEEIYQLNTVVFKDIQDSYTKQEAKDPPKRHPIHDACVAGDLQAVKRCVANNPQSLDLPDPWGITPIVIAAAKGHSNIMIYLLRQGAYKGMVTPSNNNYHGVYSGVYNQNSYGLIQNTKSAEILQILFRHGVEPNQKSSLAMEAVWHNQLDQLKWLYRYGMDEIQDASGLTPLDLAIYKANEHQDTRLLKWLLNFITRPICEDGFNRNISAEVRDVVRKHNKRLKKYATNLATRPKLRSEKDMCLSKDELTLKSFLHTDDTIYELTMKSTADLTDEEREQIYELYYNNFDKRENNTLEGKKEFLETTFPTERGKQAYIEFCRHQEKIISFMSFSVTNRHHSYSDNFILFYGKLAETEKEFTSLGLVNFVFRIPFAMKLYDKASNYWVYYKSIRPGGSYSLAGHLAYPKYEYNFRFMKHLAKLCGDEMLQEGIVDATSVVKRSGVASPKTAEYYDLVGQNQKSALPIAYKVTDKAIEDYIDRKLLYAGCDEERLLHIGDLFMQLHHANLNLIKPSTFDCRL